MKNIMQLLGWMPHVKEAWTTSGKREYTWKTNRTPFYLCVLIAVLVAIGYVYTNDLNQKLKEKEVEVKTLSAKNQDLELKISKESMLLRNAEEDEKESEDLLKRQNEVILGLTRDNGELKAKVKTLEIEKSNVESLLIAQTNLGKDLTKRLENIVASYNKVKNERGSKDLRRTYEQLSN